MRRIITISLVALCAIALRPATSQTLSDFCTSLSLFEMDESAEFARYVNVSIREDSTATKALAALITQSIDAESGEVRKITTQGYRIGLFFDNSAKARANAMAVKERFDSLFADIPSTISYDNPYFKVNAGYCTSQEEAVIMLHRIQRHFPRAYLMREVITPSNIVRSYQQEVALKRAADSLSRVTADAK